MHVCVCVNAASAPEMVQGSGSHGNASLAGQASDESTAPSALSSSSSFPPLATVMPLHGGLHGFPTAQSVPPTDQQTAVATDPGVGSRPAPPGSGAAYFPVTVHWFYCRNVELRQIWQPLSMVDSANLESAHQSLLSGKISCLHKNFCSTVAECCSRQVENCCLTQCTRNCEIVV